MFSIKHHFPMNVLLALILINKKCTPYSIFYRACHRFGQTKLGYYVGLVLGLIQIFTTASVYSKNNTRFKSGRMWLKKKSFHLTRGSYRVFHGFGQAKFAYGGSILGSSQFTLLPQLTKKTILASKVFKNDS